MKNMEGLEGIKMSEPKLESPSLAKKEAQTFERVEKMMRAGWKFSGSIFTKEQGFEITLKDPKIGEVKKFKSKRPFWKSVGADGKMGKRFA